MNRFSTQNILTCTVLSLGLVMTGCLTDDGGDDDDVISADLTIKTVTVGAQDNTTHGSALDVDEFISYKINDANSRVADIDLIYAVSTSGGGTIVTPAIYSPDSAKGGINGSAGFTFLSNFNNPRHTDIKAIALTEAGFNAITTQQKLDSLWLNANLDADGRIALSVGETFMALSNQGKKVLVRVTSISTGGTSNSASFVGQAKF